MVTPFAPDPGRRCCLFPTEVAGFERAVAGFLFCVEPDIPWYVDLHHRPRPCQASVAERPIALPPDNGGGAR